VNGRGWGSGKSKPGSDRLRKVRERRVGDEEGDGRDPVGEVGVEAERVSQEATG
jgi:hypothetical protein